jgi:hypothetical protein
MNTTKTTHSTLTVRSVRQWLEALPEEYQDVPFESSFAGAPSPIKRIVAYQSKGTTARGVSVNGLGTHLPFNDSLEWAHTLSPR